MCHVYDRDTGDVSVELRCASSRGDTHIYHDSTPMNPLQYETEACRGASEGEVVNNTVGPQIMVE